MSLPDSFVGHNGFVPAISGGQWLGWSGLWISVKESSSETGFRDSELGTQDGACGGRLSVNIDISVCIYLIVSDNLLIAIREKGTGAGKCTAAKGLELPAAQWPYYIIVMIMLIPGQLIPTPL